ncbi:MAG: putative DNA-binding domain-containing protein [Nitrosomonas sp.]|nr:MAG: putative DNA-binding domain-containing protein [Nitrosomonas sp.]
MITYNTPDRPEFIREQYALAAHIRNPEKNPCPGTIEKRRIKIYRELFYGNVEDFIANAYPVLRKILPDTQWHAMIQDYFANHIAHTPLFPEMPREFLKYLEYERKPQPDDPPFMLELAHYEWVELALSLLDEKTTTTGFDPDGDLLHDTPVISPCAWPLSYRFPVHKISPDFQPWQVGETATHLVVFRDTAFEIHFIEVNPVTARLLQLISSTPAQTGLTSLRQIATELHHPHPEMIISHGLDLLNDLKARGIIPGTANNIV